MDWNFTIAGTPIVDTGTNHNHIQLISPVGDELSIKQLGCGISYKTLGAFVKPLQHQSTKAPSTNTSSPKLNFTLSSYRPAPVNTTTPGFTTSAFSFTVSATAFPFATWPPANSTISKSDDTHSPGQDGHLP
jgi:hypothetical protein